MKGINEKTKIPKSYWVLLTQIGRLKRVKKYTKIYESVLVREGIDMVLEKYEKLLKKEKK